MTKHTQEYKGMAKLIGFDIGEPGGDRTCYVESHRDEEGKIVIDLILTREEYNKMVT